MTETLEHTARKIADQGRDALLARLRPAFEQAAATHGEGLELDDEQLERMVQRAADRADGLQWRRALAQVATEQLGIGLGEALGHPAVARAQAIVGAPSYEEALGDLGAAAPVAAATPTATNDASAEPEAAKSEVAEAPAEEAAEPAADGEQETSAEEKPEGAAEEKPEAAAEEKPEAAAEEKPEAAAEEKPEPALEEQPEPAAEDETEATDTADDADGTDEAAPKAAGDGGDGGASEDAGSPATAEQPSAPAPAPDPTPAPVDAVPGALRLRAVHLGGIANLAPAEGDLELHLSDAGLDIVRGPERVPLGRLTWDEIVALDTPAPGGRFRRKKSSDAHLVIRSAQGSASFEIPGVTTEELSEHLAPMLARHGR